MDNRLSNKNWNNVKSSKIELAILPWGATEAHNYHLPYGTDSILADFFTNESINLLNSNLKKKIALLPPIPYGVNTAQIDVTCNININHSTQYNILKDIVESLENQGILKLIIVNSHGGNSFVPMIRELLIKHDVFICLVNTYDSLNAKKYFHDPGDHAGEMETSLMLKINPRLVQPLEKAGKGTKKKFKIKSLNEGWCWAQREWLKVTEDNGIGNPELATSKKGDKYINDLTTKLAKLFEEVLLANLNDLYE